MRRTSTVFASGSTRGSVNDPDALDAALEDVEAVVHLAALGSVPRRILDPVARTTPTPPAR